MLTIRLQLLAVAVAVAGGGSVVVAQRKVDPPEPVSRDTEVKAGNRFVGSQIRTFTGTVAKVEGRVVVIDCTGNGDDEVKCRTFEAIDVLADGGLQKYATGIESYLWSDLKAGDTVRLGCVHDDDEKKWYCADVSIYRRPGGKLPKLQRPSEPNFSYRKMNLVNDIENGEDVSDDEIKKLYPPTKVIYHEDGTDAILKPATPGGLPKEWQTKLDAIREKKAKEAKDKDLKASPPPVEKK